MTKESNGSANVIEVLALSADSVLLIVIVPPVIKIVPLFPLEFTSASIPSFRAVILILPFSIVTAFAWIPSFTFAVIESAISFLTVTSLADTPCFWLFTIDKLPFPPNSILLLDTIVELVSVSDAVVIK